LRRSNIEGMPAGVSWPTYIKFVSAAALSMVAGAQTVHAFYRPLEDLEDWIEKFKEQKKIYDESKIIDNNKLQSNESDL